MAILTFYLLSWNVAATCGSILSIMSVTATGPQGEDICGCMCLSFSYKCSAARSACLIKTCLHTFFQLSLHVTYNNYGYLERYDQCHSYSCVRFGLCEEQVTQVN